MLPDSISKRNFVSISLSLLALAVLAAMTLPLTPRAAQASAGGELHVQKDCIKYNYEAGSSCTIYSSNVPAIIPDGSMVFYTQAVTANPEGGYISLDSNVVLYVATGDWAVGRCTLNVLGNQGLCTFSNGTGPLTGFTARVNVAAISGGPNPNYDYSWDGTYSFTPEP
jgi:hypothetical protein